MHRFLLVLWVFLGSLEAKLGNRLLQRLVKVLVLSHTLSPDASHNIWSLILCIEQAEFVWCMLYSTPQFVTQVCIQSLVVLWEKVASNKFHPIIWSCMGLQSSFILWIGLWSPLLGMRLSPDPPQHHYESRVGRKDRTAKHAQVPQNTCTMRFYIKCYAC